ncbi:hypothetical protein Esti_003882 [Eimeria stiedai]
MSKKNNRRARQRRQQHLMSQEKAEEKRREEKLKKKYALKDITQLLDNVELSPQPQTPKEASRKGPQEKRRSTIYQKVVSERALFSGRSKQPEQNEMETDDPASSSSSSSSGRMGGIFAGVRTLKAISKRKVASNKLGGSGIAKGQARVSSNPKKPRAPQKEALKRGLVSPKEVPSRLKHIVRRANKRIRKGAVVISPMKP